MKACSSAHVDRRFRRVALSTASWSFDKVESAFWICRLRMQIPGECRPALGKCDSNARCASGVVGSGRPAASDHWYHRSLAEVLVPMLFSLFIGLSRAGGGPGVHKGAQGAPCFPRVVPQRSRSPLSSEQDDEIPHQAPCVQAR